MTKPKHNPLEMKKPQYETELEVTQALVRREIDGVQALNHYRLAVAWQKYLKSLLPPFYRKANPNKKITWLNNTPGYTMTGGKK
jgi:hypothetical protein